MNANKTKAYFKVNNKIKENGITLGGNKKKEKSWQKLNISAFEQKFLANPPCNKIKLYGQLIT